MLRTNSKIGQKETMTQLVAPTTTLLFSALLLTGCREYKPRSELKESAGNISSNPPAAKELLQELRMSRQLAPASPKLITNDYASSASALSEDLRYLSSCIVQSMAVLTNKSIAALAKRATLTNSISQLHQGVLGVATDLEFSFAGLKELQAAYSPLRITLNTTLNTRLAKPADYTFVLPADHPNPNLINYQKGLAVLQLLDPATDTGLMANVQNVGAFGYRLDQGIPFLRRTDSSEFLLLQFKNYLDWIKVIEKSIDPTNK